MSAKQKTALSQKRTLLRTHKHVFSLNDLEEKALIRYLEKYKITNKSKFIREVLMFEVISRLEKDAPTLFESRFDKDE